MKNGLPSPSPLPSLPPTVDITSQQFTTISPGSVHMSTWPAVGGVCSFKRSVRLTCSDLTVDITLMYIVGHREWGNAPSFRQTLFCYLAEPTDNPRAPFPSRLLLFLRPPWAWHHQLLNGSEHKLRSSAAASVQAERSDRRSSWPRSYLEQHFLTLHYLRKHCR